jgi:hypothetical protein
VKIPVEKVVRDERGRCSSCGKKISKRATIHYCQPRNPNDRNARRRERDRERRAAAKAAKESTTDPIEPGQAAAAAEPEPEVKTKFTLADVWGESDDDADDDDAEAEERRNGGGGDPTPGAPAAANSSDERARVRAVLSEGGVTIYKYWHRALGGVVNWVAGTTNTDDALKLSDKEERELAELGNLAYPLDVSAKAAYIAALLTIFGGYLLTRIDKIASRLSRWGERRKAKTDAKKKIEEARALVAQGGGGNGEGQK